MTHIRVTTNIILSFTVGKCIGGARANVCCHIDCEPFSLQSDVEMHDRHRPCPNEVLFEDHVTRSDGRSQPHLVLLQLTSETLVVRRLKASQVSSSERRDEQTMALRHVTLKRHPITHSLGFSIKGGCDTGTGLPCHSIFSSALFIAGFPVLISRVVYANTHLLHVGDAILSINNENIAHLTHEQVMSKLCETGSEPVSLTVRYMNDMAPYLHSATGTARSSLSSSIIPAPQPTSFTLPTSTSIRVRRKQNRMSAEYPSGYHRASKQPRQQRLSLMLSNQEKVRLTLSAAIDPGFPLPLSRSGYRRIRTLESVVDLRTRKRSVSTSAPRLCQSTTTANRIDQHHHRRR